jgi:serine/threonine-protein kinase HipA
VTADHRGIGIGGGLREGRGSEVGVALGEGRARLAPLYDVASALPYRETAAQKLKLAMKVGGTYRLRDIGPDQWAKLETELKLETDRVMRESGACS